MIIKNIQAPQDYMKDDLLLSVFLAGSIEMGSAVEWQNKVEESFVGRYDDVLDNETAIIYNPRRTNWNSSWVQSIDNEEFKSQVTWEHKYLMLADYPIFYFDPNTKSPITLMELGMVSENKDFRTPIVCCPEGYWRKGNVDILCESKEIETVDTLDDLIEKLHLFIRHDVEDFMMDYEDSIMDKANAF